MGDMKLQHLYNLLHSLKLLEQTEEIKRKRKYIKEEVKRREKIIYENK